MTKTKKTNANPTPKSTKRTKAAKPADAPTEGATLPPVDLPREPRPDAGGTTLHDVLAAFHTALEQSDKTPTTIASYRAELELAGKTIGLETPVAELTEERVRAYFESDAVTMKKNGREKSPLSIDKTRRVFRQALVWAADRGILPAAPVPAMTSAVATT